MSIIFNHFLKLFYFINLFLRAHVLYIMKRAVFSTARYTIQILLLFSNEIAINFFVFYYATFFVESVVYKLVCKFADVVRL